MSGTTSNLIDDFILIEYGIFKGSSFEQYGFYSIEVNSFLKLTTDLLAQDRCRGVAGQWRFAFCCRNSVATSRESIQQQNRICVVPGARIDTFGNLRDLRSV
jgi:hypothetical protein